MSAAPFSTKLTNVINELHLMKVAGGHLDTDEILVTTSELNRPGLQLTGFTSHFASDRLQIIGWTETAYLVELEPAVREERLDDYFALGFPALIVTRGEYVMPDMVAAADRHNVIVLATDMMTSEFVGALNRSLARELALRETIEASFVDVYGEGVLILGDSGVAKAETALELVRRGHRLVADGSVEVRRISDAELSGQSAGPLRHFLEIAGVGVINVKRLYGVGAVKAVGDINFVVLLEPRDPNKEYERLGMDDQFTQFLGVSIPLLTIPVQPGRNLAVIIEVAAIDQRQRAFGYNAAVALDARAMGLPAPESD